MSLWTRTEHRAREAKADRDVKTAAKTAYDRGRRDERATHKRHPLGMTVLVVLAIVGAGLLGLAAYKGSFGGGGAVADQQISNAAPAVQSAVSNAGQAAQAAGSDLVQKGRDLASHNKG